MRSLDSAPVPKTKKEIALEVTRYLSIVAMAASGALYAAPIARQVPELITGEDNPAAGYTLAAFAAFGKMMIYAVQFVSVLNAISKENAESGERFSFSKKAGIAALAISTMLAAFLLAVIQLRESAFDYGNFQYPIAIFAALNEGIEVGLSFTVLTYIWLVKNYLFDQPEEEETPLNINGDYDQEPMFPGRMKTVSALLVPVISLGVLVYSYLDEYFRTLPGKINPIVANVLSSLGIPGILLIGVLGLGSFCQLLENRSSFKDLNKFILFLTLIFSAAAASMEFKLGTETARDNYVLGMVLGSINVVAQTIITQSFMYQGLDKIKEGIIAVTDIISKAVRNYGNCPAPVTEAPAFTMS
jgi:hypothetical protein